MKRQKFNFSVAAVSFRFVFCFRLKIFTSEVSNLLTFGGRMGWGPGTVNLDLP